MVIGAVVVSTSVVTVDSWVGAYGRTSTGILAIVGVAVENPDQLAAESSHVVGLQGQVFGQLVLGSEAELLVVGGNQVLVDVTRNRGRQSGGEQSLVDELPVAGERESEQPRVLEWSDSSLT